MTDIERDQAKLDRDLLRLGCVPDPDWNPSAGVHYQVGVLEHVRRINRGLDALLILDNDGWIRWALMTCEGYPTDDPTAIRFQLAMHGEGPGGKDDSLREPRHTWFGPSAYQRGYLFYVQPKLLDWAFDQLREFFDFAGDEP